MLRSIAINTIIFTIGLALSLIVVECGYRLAGKSSPQISRWSDRPEFYYKPEESNTTQDYPYKTKKPADTFRISVVGDSFTFAPYMQFDDAFPNKLERMFNLNANKERVEVINLGVPGFSTTHEVKATKRAIRRESDLILLQITLNDPQVKQYRPTGLTGVGNSFGSYQPSPKMKSIFQYWSSLEFVVSRLHNTTTHQAYVQYYHDLFESKRSWKPFEKALLAISETAAESGTPLAAVIFPLFGVPLDKDYPFHPLHQKVASVLKTKNVPTLDLFNTFQGIPLSRIQVMPGEDFHPNEIGHRLAAEKIYSWLAENQLVPERFLIRHRFARRTQIREPIALAESTENTENAHD